MASTNKTRFGESHLGRPTENNEGTAIDWNRLYHEQNLRLHGIYVPDTDIITTKAGRKMFREFRLQFSSEDTAMDPVSLKLAMVSRDATPYSFQAGALFFRDTLLAFPGTVVYQVPIPPAENGWHLKGYTFPYRGSRNPYFELRLNLRITGHCPGKCFFCHRTHSHRLTPDVRKCSPPGEILDRVVLEEGPEVFKKITRIMFISELFGREDRFIEAVAATRTGLTQRGYPLENEFNCCAHDVRSVEGLRVLREYVKPDRYSFTLEFFRDREKFMGPYKGLPIENVCQILANARLAGFEDIQLNYLAGIDSLEQCQHGFRELAQLNLVNSVGLSTFTIFSEEQLELRHPDAWDPSYYLEVVNILNSMGIKIYRPESYDMGCAYSVLMEKTQM